MPGVARRGDLFGTGGVLQAPFAPNVLANGRPIALNNCTYSAHPPCSPKQPQHCFGTVRASARSVKVLGMAPLMKGDVGKCGHKVQFASQDVIIGG